MSLSFKFVPSLISKKCSEIKNKEFYITGSVVLISPNTYWLNLQTKTKTSLKNKKLVKIMRINKNVSNNLIHRTHNKDH